MNSQAEKVLAIYDFDGTVTKKDSFLSFIVFVTPWYGLIFKSIFAAPVLIAFVLKLLPNERAKELIITIFMKGMSKNHFQSKASSFAQLKLPDMLRPAAKKSLDDHRNAGHQVVILTASTEDLLGPFCKTLHWDIIGTKLEWKNGLCTGKLATPNCRGREKVRRLTAVYDLEEFTEIYAYGDSSADLHFIKLADHQFFRPFRKTKDQ